MSAEEADALVAQVAVDWTAASLPAAERALCVFADKLTRTPQTMSPEDLDALRAAGFDDTAIHDAAQVISYFNYINRIADALGVEPEAFVKPWDQGPAAVAEWVPPS